MRRILLLLMFCVVGVCIGKSQSVVSNDSLLTVADKLFESKDYVGAAKLYRSASILGNPDAQNKLGFCYMYGTGVPKNTILAVNCFRKAAEKGYAKAQFNLANCYYMGHGTSLNLKKSAEWMLKAAEQNYEPAMQNISTYYRQGIGVMIDMVQSKLWQEKWQKVSMAEMAAASSTGASSDASLVAESKACTSSQTTVSSQPKSEADKKPADASAKKETVVKDPFEQPKPKDPFEQPKTSSPAPIENKQTSPSDTIKISANAPQPLLVQQSVSGQNASPAIAQSAVSTTEISPHNMLNVSLSGSSSASVPLQETKKNIPSDQPTAKVETVSAGIVQQVPEIKILYPENQTMFHEENMTIKYQLLNGTGQNTRITVLIDGIRQPVNRAVKAANSIEIDLPKKDCSVMLMAQNQYGYGAPAMIQLTWDKSYDNLVLPNLYVLSIGIGKYTDSKLPPLKYSAKDASDVAEAFSKKKGKPYADVKVKLIKDDEATRSAIFDGLTWLKENATSNDVCVFFYAGHGYRDEKDRFFFMPVDGKSDKTYTCFSASDFRTMAEDVRGKFLVLTDACYSAALMDGNRSVASNHFVEQLRRTHDGLFLIASSSADTKSKEDDSWGNGAFTKALVEAVNGAAKKDNREGLTMMDLQYYLDRRVGELTQHKQVPVAINVKGIENFSLFLYDEK